MLLNYKSQFEEHLLSGRKIHTFRTFRNRFFKPGDKLQHYVGVRTKKARLIMENVCISTQWTLIRINSDEGLSFKIDNQHIDDVEVMEIVWNDGFDSEADYMEFFSNHPNAVEINATTWEIELQLIHWTHLKYPFQYR